ncbi:MAG: hypothetical protein PHD31_02185 [Candidatus Pacebacteria bacterium]|nr:hypothetical protein [Candidatus Paceibacterota bacterium]
MVIIQDFIKENQENIQKSAKSIALTFGEMSEEEIDSSVAEISKRLKSYKFYFSRDIEEIADKQLNKLSIELNRLVEERLISQKNVEEAIEHLEWKKRWAVERAAETPMIQNKLSKHLPIMPVINDNFLNASLLMNLLIGEEGDVGTNRVPLNKINNNYDSSSSKKCYWVVDSRINERQFGCSFFTAAEIIAYAFHANVLNEYCLYAVESRYKHKKNYPGIMLSLIDKQPVLHRENYCKSSIVKTARPFCTWRLVH